MRGADRIDLLGVKVRGSNFHARGYFLRTFADSSGIAGSVEYFDSSVFHGTKRDLHVGNISLASEEYEISALNVLR